MRFDSGIISLFLVLAAPLGAVWAQDIDHPGMPTIIHSMPGGQPLPTVSETAPVSIITLSGTPAPTVPPTTTTVGPVPVRPSATPRPSVNPTTGSPAVQNAANVMAVAGLTGIAGLLVL
ncbi:hypothetical protein BC832DRAFT_544336 [Gaertneriomyces semiglobifer]|nr:hypothetical protein BC832DRAFT_544336 [Gaertneriomyces semiglobifer]